MLFPRLAAPHAWVPVDQPGSALPLLRAERGRDTVQCSVSRVIRSWCTIPHGVGVEGPARGRLGCPSSTASTADARGLRGRAGRSAGDAALYVIHYAGFPQGQAGELSAPFELAGPVIEDNATLGALARWRDAARLVRRRFRLLPLQDDPVPNGGERCWSRERAKGLALRRRRYRRRSQATALDT